MTTACQRLIRHNACEQVFLSGLPLTATDDELLAFCSAVGEVLPSPALPRLRFSSPFSTDELIARTMGAPFSSMLQALRRALL